MGAIFISHSSKDNAWAERIRQWLKDEQQQRPEEQRYRSLFLDFDPDDGLHAGERWQDQLYEHLQLCVAVIVICSEAYAASQWCLAELGVAMASGKLVLPVRIEATSPLPKLLSETQATALAVIDLEGGSSNGWGRLLKGLAPLSWQSRLPWPPADEPLASPFPGMYQFERRHAAVFYGQDTVLRQVQETISALPQHQSRLVLILGASGCGKSSLLRAGLLPWLAEVDRRRWIVLEPFRPETAPWAALYGAVRQAFGALQLTPPAEAATTAPLLLQQLRDLRLQSGRQDARVVVPIDQFEELLERGEGHDPDVAAAADSFLTQLAELLAQKGSQVLVLATLRSDFLGSLQLHQSHLDRLWGSPILLGPMDVDGFRQVIEGPARRVGLRLELGLCDRLVRDTATGDALPLLAFTLRGLWDGKGAGSPITLEQYQKFGGIDGAVQRRADEVIATSGATEVELEALRRGFIDRLIRLSSDGKVAKQPAQLESLPSASRRLVGLLVDARLLVTGKGEEGELVEIAHEALLRTWPKLKGWMDEGREELLLQQKVARLSPDLAVDAPQRQRRQALEQLAALAAEGGIEHKAVAKEGLKPLAQLLAPRKTKDEDPPTAPEADRADAALILALIGAEEPLSACLDDEEVPVAVRRRVAESLGVLASRSTDRKQRRRIDQKLEYWLRRAQFTLRVTNALDWKKHDERLPLLQGASRGLSLSASTDLPLIGGNTELRVPSLTLFAVEDGGGLKISTDIIEKPIWIIPLPNGEHLEFVHVPSGVYDVGSSPDEIGRNEYDLPVTMANPDDPEKRRSITIASFYIMRYPLTQSQWRVIVANQGTTSTRELDEMPGKAIPVSLAERYACHGMLAVESVNWNDAIEWVSRLNSWLANNWLCHSPESPPPRVSLPNDCQWEVACRGKALTPFHFGDTLDPSWARFRSDDSTYGMGRKSAKPRQVGIVGESGIYNSFGIADMHGQVAEWCYEFNHKKTNNTENLDLQAASHSIKDLPISSHDFRLALGGCFIYRPMYARSACKLRQRSDFDGTDVGIRLVV